MTWGGRKSEIVWRIKTAAETRDKTAVLNEGGREQLRVNGKHQGANQAAQECPVRDDFSIC